MNLSNHQRDPIERVAVLHAAPDEFRHELELAHSDVEFHWVTSGDEIDATMSMSKPDAVFAIRKTDFGGPWHRRAAFFPGVRWVHVGGSGYDHLLPLESDTTCITNGAGVLAPFVAETALAGMLTLNHQIHQYFDQKNRKLWKPLAFRPIAGQTLLIVGLGAIGNEIAQRAKALGMHVIALSRRPQHTRTAIAEHYPIEKLRNLLPRADVVTLHVRHTAETTHLIDSRALARMKPGALLINTARGALVDEGALASALESGRLAGAYLDVFEQEPLPSDSPLWRCRNALLTPHTADNVVGWVGRMAEFFSENLARWNSGQPLRNIVTDHRVTVCAPPTVSAMSQPTGSAE